MPSRTAWTARLRSAAWAAPGRDRASLFGMPQIYHIITLFAYLGNIYRNIQYVTQHTIHDVHKQLKKIADEVRRWSAPGSGGQGRVPEGRARGLRPGRPALPGPPRQQPGAPRGG